MDAGPRFDSYDWAGGREPMLRFGPADGPVAVLALPLFEEANRTRAFGLSILRALAARGIGGVLPELPGQGESELPTGQAALAGLRAAFAAAAGEGYPVAIRSGALLVDGPAWLLAPQDGPALLRELARVKGEALAGKQVEVAGNCLSAALIEELAGATSRLPGESRGPGAASEGRERTTSIAPQLGPGLRRGGADRVVRLSADARTADRHVNGPALWRRAEPDDDAALAQILAGDIADWIASCGG